MSLSIFNHESIYTEVLFIFSRKMLSSMGISYLHVSVFPFVLCRCSTETATHRIMPTMPHNSPATLVFTCWKSEQNLNAITPNGGTKCSWGRLNAGAISCKLVTFDAKHCQLSLVASLSHWAFTLFVCSTFAMMQHVRVCQRQLILVIWLSRLNVYYQSSYGWQHPQM